MFGFGMPELIVILVIVLVVFGAGRLPEIGAALGKSIKNNCQLPMKFCFGSNRILTALA